MNQWIFLLVAVASSCICLPFTNAFISPSGVLAPSSPSSSSWNKSPPIQFIGPARSGTPWSSTTPTKQSSRAPPLSALFGFGGIELGNVIYDSTSTAFDAWEWTNAIGAPAALVAGAVLVTLSETRQDTAPRKMDSKRTRFLKLSMRFLLLTSFAFEVVSIFVATMTGSVLLGHGEQKVAKKLIGYGSPLQLMQHHHEFEYLTTQICFLQGLFNWLGAVTVELLLPKPDETRSAQRMNKCLAGWLTSLIIWMLAFYNHHISFYSDYFSMLRRFVGMFVSVYVMERPLRPLSLLYIPSFLYSIWLTWKAFRSPPELDD